MTVLGSGWDVASPKGERYRFADAASPHSAYITQLSAAGQLSGLAVLDGALACLNLAGGPAGGWSVGCWEIPPEDGLNATYFVRSGESKSPETCAP